MVDIGLLKKVAKRNSMAKNKLRRFSEMKEWSNVFEPTLDEKYKEPFHLK